MGKQLKVQARGKGSPTYRATHLDGKLMLNTEFMMKKKEQELFMEKL